MKCNLLDHLTYDHIGSWSRWGQLQWQCQLVQQWSCKGRGTGSAWVDDFWQLFDLGESFPLSIGPGLFVVVVVHNSRRMINFVSKIKMPQPVWDVHAFCGIGTFGEKDLFKSE